MPWMKLHALGSEPRDPASEQWCGLHFLRINPPTRDLEGLHAQILRPLPKRLGTKVLQQTMTEIRRHAGILRLDVFVRVREVESPAPGHEEFPPGRRHRIEHRNGDAGPGGHLGSTQASRSRADNAQPPVHGKSNTFQTIPAQDAQAVENYQLASEERGRRVFFVRIPGCASGSAPMAISKSLSPRQGGVTPRNSQIFPPDAGQAGSVGSSPGGIQCSLLCDERCYPEADRCSRETDRCSLEVGSRNFDARRPLPSFGLVLKNIPNLFSRGGQLLMFP